MLTKFLEKKIFKSYYFKIENKYLVYVYNKMKDIYKHILQSKKEGKKLLILIDPDKQNNVGLSSIINKADSFLWEVY